MYTRKIIETHEFSPIRHFRLNVVGPLRLGSTQIAIRAGMFWETNSLNGQIDQSRQAFSSMVETAIPSH
jgi:hypothetical protein